MEIRDKSLSNNTKTPYSGLILIISLKLYINSQISKLQNQAFQALFMGFQNLVYMLVFDCS